MASYFFKHEIHDKGIKLELCEKKLLGKGDKIKYSEWSEKADESYALALAKLNAILEDHNSEYTDSTKILTLTHKQVAELSDPVAISLSLPPSIPFALNIQANGTINQSDFNVFYSWKNSGGVPLNSAKVNGAFLSVGEELYRIPSPIYDIVSAIDSYKEANLQDEAFRFEKLSDIKEAMAAAELENVFTDGYFSNLRILHASSFSLHIPADTDAFQFDPVLFSKKVVRRSAEDGEPITESQSLLTEHMQNKFARERFRQFEEARSKYPIEKGTYVFLDHELTEALGVVKEMQSADVATRKSFAKNPQLFLKDRLGDRLSDEYIEGLFVETEQYSERVVDIGIWQPTVLPWLQKKPNSWLPESFGIQIGDINLEIDPKDVDEIKGKIESAIKRGDETVQFNGHEIPANAQSLNAIDQLTGIVAPSSEHIKDDVILEPDAKELDENLKHFLIVDENFEEIKFAKSLKKRADMVDTKIKPSCLKSVLKPHQEIGYKWLLDSWASGLAGVLLADDMGLGKTIQAIVFLAWLKEKATLGDGNVNSSPSIIVAPTGLLKNWQEEIEKHLYAPFLGNLCLAYGGNLKYLKNEDALNGTDIKTGRSALNRGELSKADVILTTYEAIRDYHHSFAAIKFDVVIYDEVQKAKNPTSQISCALKTINTDFTIAMTGTPVENRLEDLWTILDIANPGYLGDLKSFSSKYQSECIDDLHSLNDQLSNGTEEHPPIMLRRMKSGELKGLPQKNIIPVEGIMPLEQANRYSEAINSAQSSKKPPMLQILHQMRSISLHPVHPDAADLKNIESYINQSARLKTTVELLDQIKKRGEKALVFLEDLSMQALLAEILKRRYKLDSYPMRINGQVKGEKRQEMVSSFQSKEGFDVMILSPKAGGVGLTLTAANNVIHLSRWWNPAVEDQSTDRVYRIGQEKDVNVYLPIAVHPNPAFRESSFDLKLNTLLEGKRQLMKDVIMPPESKEDYTKLYSDVFGIQDDYREEAIKISDLDGMTGIEFEQWVINQAKQRGFVAKATPVSGDGGADAILVHKETGSSLIVQCKQSQSSKIGEQIVDDLLRARERYELNEPLLVAVTNQEYTSRTIVKIEKHKIKQFDRHNIMSWPYGF